MAAATRVDTAAAWRQQMEQMRAGLAQIKVQAPPELHFSGQTFQRAERLLDQLAQSPPEERLEAVGDDLPPEATLELEEMVQAVRPAVRGMAPDTARKIVVGYVATVVFLLVVQLSISHPEVAEVLVGVTGVDALASAYAAAWATGKVWDRLQRDEPESENLASDD
ncbi:hypothetical protein FBY35_0135 [Streptomyces sp. SLBN-118]|nr:hypothetical protein FBY35_0135 [Streptomyces sp. SLBN-118]